MKWLIFLSSISLLCAFDISLCECLESIDYLNDCLNERYNSKQRNIHFVTYFSPNIMKYALKGAFINMHWASVQNYSFFIYNSSFAESHNLIEYSDERWTKIKILQHAMLTAESMVEYVVWVDSDLIITRDSFNLSSVLTPLSQYEIILSRDMFTAPFVANTGTIVCKKTAWTMRFLETWWDAYDRSTHCDQHSLDKLIHAGGVNISSHIHILPANVLNSEFPVYEHMLPDDNVLHLAGFSDSVVRYPLFSLISRRICRKYSISDVRSEEYLENTERIFDITAVDIEAWISVDELRSIISVLSIQRLFLLRKLMVSVQNWIITDVTDITRPKTVYVAINNLNTAIRYQLLDVFKLETELLAFSRTFLNEKCVNIDKIRGFFEFQVNESNFCLHNWLSNEHQVATMRSDIYYALSEHSMVLSSQCNAISAQLNDASSSLFCLEVYKETFSIVVETVMASRSEYSYVALEIVRNVMMLLKAYNSVIYPMFSLDTVNPSTKGRVVYYKFKYLELLTSEFRRLLESNDDSVKQKVFAVLEQHKQLLSIIIQQPYHHTVDTFPELIKVLWLKTLSTWRELSVYKYYGTHYIQADPYKEGYELMYECAEYVRLSMLDYTGGVASDKIDSLVLSLYNESLSLREITITQYFQSDITSIDIVIREYSELFSLYMQYMRYLLQRAQTQLKLLEYTRKSVPEAVYLNSKFEVMHGCRLLGDGVLVRAVSVLESIVLKDWLVSLHTQFVSTRATILETQQRLIREFEDVVVSVKDELKEIKSVFEWLCL